MKEIILASASSRRADILSSCGIVFSVVASGVDEVTTDGRHVSDIVRYNAEKKAVAVASGKTEAIVIGADTLVLYGELILGKPSGETEARKMLMDFSGGEIEVYTGICVIDTASGRKATGFEVSGLMVVHLAEEEVERYFRLLGPYDKAGGFSIEGVGAMIFDNIRGSYFNILGLPMMKLRELMSDIDIEILDYVKK